ncbi:ATP-binding protein [Brevundimonas sp. 2R-24]|uniref:histidine kinase n=1 Tax=Peiella sedimenti TaxID=3061083 RepID=A0ABT8SQH7_9CAUL|nr:ATP-binding protein [Caulobacteraceae bacterium XZ-24]
MRPRFTAWPTYAQVAALVAASVALGQAVAFAIVTLAPPPPPQGATVPEVAAALSAGLDGARRWPHMRLSVSDQPPPDNGSRDPLGAAYARAVAEELDLPPASVVVRSADGPGRHGFAFKRRVGDVHNVIVMQAESVRLTPPAPPPAPPAPAPGGALPPPPPAPPRPPLPPEVIGERVRLAETLLVRSGVRISGLSASVRRPDGQWLTASPRPPLISPWHVRMGLGFLLTTLLLGPLAWWVARRLTRPIRVFAEAAERLGADPAAPPLALSGPAEVRSAARAFNDMQAKLQAYVQGRTRMVAAIAHDLRTPLTRLRFRAEQARPGVRDKMAADIDEMDQMIGQVLAFVRGEQARQSFQPVDLAALVRDVVQGFRDTGAEVQADLVSEAVVPGDAVALRRAVANLIDNAVKFAGRGRVRLASEADQIAVVIEDEGPGLPDDALEAALEPFQRGDPSRNRETGGVGLGLAVAQSVARAHGGRVVLSNRSPRGLEARLILSTTHPKEHS